MNNAEQKSSSPHKEMGFSSPLAWRWFWLPLVLLFILSITLILLWSSNEHSSLMDHIKQDESHSLQVYTAEIYDSLDHVYFDLKWLPEQNELIEWLDTGKKDALDRVVKEYATLIRNRSFYDHLRMLDESGKEVFRVGLVDSVPYISPEDDLQVKSDRYYFKESFRLPKGDLYISPLDLNFERGQLEIPYKPMIRLIVPVYDSADHWRGSLIFNYLGNELISNLKKLSTNATGSLMMLNNNGYWLISNDPANEWGFVLEERKTRMFQTDFPAVWSILNQSTRGQLLNDDGLFSFAKVGIQTHWKERLVVGNGSEIVASGAEWKIISHIPAQTLTEKFTRLENSKWMFLVLAASCSLFVSSLLFRGRKKNKAHQDELEKMAFYDDLTGLTNRALFVDRLQQQLKESRRGEDRFALMEIDLDGFKNINDSFGHDGGDHLLCLVAERLLQSVRATDIVARTGGDEFSIILPRIENQQAVERVAEKILENLSLTFQIKKQDCHIGASIGISVSFDNQELDASTLWKQADIAMYQAKQGGRNRFCHFSQVKTVPSVSSE